MSEPIEDAEVVRFLDSWFQVRQFIQAANFNRFHKAGLSATQFMILNLLPEGGTPLSIRELAQRMNLKPPTVVKAVETLEHRNMLQRGKDPSDGRVVLLQITSEGAKFQNAAAGQFREQIAGIFRAMPAEDREGLLRGLERFTDEAAKVTQQLEAPGESTAPGRDARGAKRNAGRSPQH